MLVPNPRRVAVANPNRATAAVARLSGLVRGFGQAVPFGLENLGRLGPQAYDDPAMLVVSGNHVDERVVHGVARTSWTELREDSRLGDARPSSPTLLPSADWSGHRRGHVAVAV